MLKLNLALAVLQYSINFDDQCRTRVPVRLQVTKTVLSHVSDQRWWRRTLKNIQPLSASESRIDERRRERNDAFDKNASHPFFASVVTNVVENWVARCLQNL